MKTDDGLLKRRRRDHAAEYRRRLIKGKERGLSRAQAVGHARDAGERSPAQFFAERCSRVTGFFEPDEKVAMRVSRRDMQRVVAHHRLERLERGEISPDEFRRRVNRWRPVQGRRFVSDPATALTMRMSVPLDDRYCEWCKTGWYSPVTEWHHDGWCRMGMSGE